MPEKRNIPDTLMLEDRARLALNVLTKTTNEDFNYMPYFSCNFLEKPAKLAHSLWDAGTVGRHMEGLLLAKEMCGSTEGDFYVEKLRVNLEDSIKANGLTYRTKTDYCEGNANFHDQPHALGAFTLLYMLDGDKKAREMADNMCAGLKKVSFNGRNCWYLPDVEMNDRGEWPIKDVEYMRTASDPAHINGRMMNHLIKYYQVTGNTDALELAENYSRQVVYYSAAFNPDGSFNDKMEFRNGHYHSRMITLASVARYAAYAHNADMLSWANKVYSWVLTTCTNFGWTPGGRNLNKAYLHETCTLTDVIETGIVLAQNGYPQYWNTVDRFVRNHLAETQLLDGSWIESRNDKSMDVVDTYTYYNVGERMVGAFAGYAAPNDFCSPYGNNGGHLRDMQACCQGSGTRGLFLAWSNIVTADGASGRVFVNLMLNRATKWLDVSSYMPHENKVELYINKDIRDLYVKIPDWVKFHTITVRRERGGQSEEWAPASWLDVHIRVGSVLKGDRITVTYPLRRVKTVEKAVDELYNTTWIGDDVVDIDPPGIHYPLYGNRKVLDRAPMKEDALYRLSKGIYW